VILLTGTDYDNLPQEGTDAGASAVLTKPCTPDRLLQTIGAACGKR
jgi:DNA-binding response OmpR family regulator